MINAPVGGVGAGIGGPMLGGIRGHGESLGQRRKRRAAKGHGGDGRRRRVVGRHHRGRGGIWVGADDVSRRRYR